MSETQKQYIKQINGYWLKDEEAREELRLLDIYKTPYPISPDTPCSELKTALQRFREHGEAVLYQDNNDGDLDWCVLIGTDFLYTKAAFYKPSTDEILVVSNISGDAPVSEKMTRRKRVQHVTEEDTEQDFATAASRAENSGTQLLYQLDTERAFYMGRGYDTNLSKDIYRFFDAATLGIISVWYDENSIQQSQLSPLVSVDYNAETEEMLIGSITIDQA